MTMVVEAVEVAEVEDPAGEEAAVAERQEVVVEGLQEGLQEVVVAVRQVVVVAAAAVDPQPVVDS